MGVLLLFATTLLISVFISQRASRSVLSTAVLFLIVGFVAGPGVSGVIRIKADDDIVVRFVELALFSVLFTDGMKVGVRDLTSAWRLPGRALLLGLPLTLLFVGLLAKFLLGLSWAEAFIIGAILSPTDPVFAAAIVGRKEVPKRLRHLLNVESGLNDGLALPIVIVALALAAKSGFEPLTIFSELATGVLIGVLVPWLAIKLEGSRFLASSAPYKPLLALAIALLVFALTSLFHANGFLGAFAAGMTIATMDVSLREHFHQLGEIIAEVLKLCALLLFGALIDPAYFSEIGIGGWVFILLVLVLARPLAMAFSFIGAELSRREWFTLAWFGPKGFATVFFSFLVLQANLENREWLFHLLAVMVAASIIAHSSTDVLIAKGFVDETDGGEKLGK